MSVRPSTPAKLPKRCLNGQTFKSPTKRGRGSPRTASETKAAWVPSLPRGVQRDRVAGEPPSRAIEGKIHKAGQRHPKGGSNPLRLNLVCVAPEICGFPFYRLSAENSASLRTPVFWHKGRRTPSPLTRKRCPFMPLLRPRPLEDVVNLRIQILRSKPLECHRCCALEPGRLSHRRGGDR